MKNSSKGVQVCSSLHLKPVPVAGFIVYNKNLANTLPKFYHYRKPKLVRGKAGWYIEYYYRIPAEVRGMYLNVNGEPKEWERFRIREDLNRRKGKEREIYAEWLLNEITSSLESGYNPFRPDLETHSENKIEDSSCTDINITDALIQYIQHVKDRGLERTSVAKYEKVIYRFLEWLKTKRIPYTEANNITTDLIEKWLLDMKKTFGFKNREYNNHFTFIRTAFNYLLKKKLILTNPCIGIEKQKTKASKHRYFDDQTLRDITRALEVQEPYTLLAFLCVYHLCIRSEKELKYLKIENINFDANNILIVESKTDHRYVPMDDVIKAKLKEYVNGHPKHFYLFGIKGVPSNQPFGKGFFSKRFKKVRESIGISSDYTIYGAKHTRIVHLKKDGATDAEIMKLGGWRDYNSMSKYMRDLGMDADMEVLNRLSRKI